MQNTTINETIRRQLRRKPNLHSNSVWSFFCEVTMYFKKKLISIYLRRAVLARDEGVCHYCGKIGKPGHYPDKVFEIIHSKEVAFEIDHIVPEFMGGKAVLGNLTLACRKCNRSKGWRRNG